MIENRADIIFDYNLAVIANTSIDAVFIVPTVLPSESSFSNSILIYPNPFSSSTSLRAVKIFNNVTLTVYNLYGQTIIFYRDNFKRAVFPAVNTRQ